MWGPTDIRGTYWHSTPLPAHVINQNETDKI